MVRMNLFVYSVEDESFAQAKTAESDKDVESDNREMISLCEQWLLKTPTKYLAFLRKSFEHCNDQVHYRF